MNLFYPIFLSFLLVVLGACILLFVIDNYTEFIRRKKMSNKYNQDGSISENWLAEEIALREGKSMEQDIAQIKEQLKITLYLLADLRENETDKFDELINKHG